MRFRRLGVSTMALTVIVMAVTVAAAAGNSAGTVYYQDVVLGDRLETRGDPVVFDVSLVTHDRFAVVHLENGRVVKVAANSAVRFSRGDGTDITMTVYAGHASTVAESGRVLRAGAIGAVSLPARVENVLEVEEQLVLDGMAGPERLRGAARRRY